MKNLKKKALLKVLGLGLVISLFGAKINEPVKAYADSTDDTNEWERVGDPTYTPIDKEDQNKYTQDTIKAQENGEPLPAEQDAGAVITDAPADQVTEIDGSDEWEDYPGDENDFIVDEGLEDEIDRKNNIYKTGDASAVRIWKALASVGITGIGIYEIIKYRKYRKLAEQEEDIKKHNM